MEHFVLNHCFNLDARALNLLLLGFASRQHVAGQQNVFLE